MSERKQNPPIPGHHLLHEGLNLPVWNDQGEITGHTGGCQCGAKPERFPDFSARQMKAWHRGHKEEIRAERGEPM